jgi:hypothetical protein
MLNSVNLCTVLILSCEHFGDQSDVRTMFQHSAGYADIQEFNCIFIGQWDDAYSSHLL